jgi:aspartyl-tRNA(Asn)/glutamyl-tRNA(Gln) amidotransferase subunit A
VVSTAASGEQVGVYAPNAAEAKTILSLIAGHDSKDGTSLRNDSYDYACQKPLSQMKVGVVKALWDKADEATKAALAATKTALEKQGVSFCEIEVDFTAQANVAWQILMTAETCNNVSRYDGVKYGRRAEEYKDIDQLYVNSRTEGLSFLTKAVILYGSDVLSKNRYDACYRKSLQVRRVIAEKLAALAESYDALLMPACSQ